MDFCSCQEAKMSKDVVSWPFEQPPHFHGYWFEHFNDEEWKEYMSDHWKLPFYVCAGYLLLIFSIQSLMRKRAAFKLQKALAFWNLSLGLFSMMGLYRVGSELLYVLLAPNGFYRSICVREKLNEPAAFFCLLFALSKFVELGDTIFIVLRKQPLIFLQWYHHCTSMILAWQVIPYSEPICRWYGVMNYGVHSIMYPYFALKALKVQIPKKISMTITILQLAQMIIGVGVNLYSLYVLGTEAGCAREPYSIKLIGTVYGSFMVLFADFLYKSYFGKSKKL